MVSSFLSVNYELPKDHASRQHTVPQSSFPSTAATGSSLGSAGPMFADDRVDSNAPARAPRDRFRHGCVAPYSGVVCWLCSVEGRLVGRGGGDAHGPAVNASCPAAPINRWPAWQPRTTRRTATTRLRHALRPGEVRAERSWLNRPPRA